MFLGWLAAHCAAEWKGWWSEAGPWQCAAAVTSTWSVVELCLLRICCSWCVVMVAACDRVAGCVVLCAQCISPVQALLAVLCSVHFACASCTCLLALVVCMQGWLLFWQGWLCKVIVERHTCCIGLWCVMCIKVVGCVPWSNPGQNRSWWLVFFPNLVWPSAVEASLLLACEKGGGCG